MGFRGTEVKGWDERLIHAACNAKWGELCLEANLQFGGFSANPMPGYVTIHNQTVGLFPGSATLETRHHLDPNPIHRVPPGPHTSVTLALTLTLGIVEPWER